ncbi:MAG: hypothetical protein H3Z52_12445 [archaeon]|nr:hypothetical protein [archaeon]MCP8321729.1 hypothetical protein [archaeon]
MSKTKASTSIKIDPGLWKEAKIEAIRRDTEVSKLVEDAISMWLEILRGDNTQEQIMSIIRKRLSG